MTRAVLPHDPADAALIADVVSLGALPPAYTRDQHPGLFDCWEARAFWIRTCAARASEIDLADAIAEADLYSGQPLPEKVEPIIVPAARAGFDVLDLLEAALAAFFRRATA